VSSGNLNSEDTGLSLTSQRSLVGESIDQYKIVEVLGKGGMSVVYKAVHSILKNTVAIKTMHAHLVSEQQSVMRFKQEARAAAQLDHPNIIKVLGFGITSGDSPQPYIIMDFLEGAALSDAIKQKGRLSVASTLKIFIQICSALSHAHKHGVIHRDLKPSNIMLVEKDGEPDFVKLVDFGIAKVLNQEGEQAHRLTQTGEVFGSPSYMSPEQCTGKTVDNRSDVYSLGCVLYEALSGNPPHQGDSVFETFHKHLAEIPASLSIPEVGKPLSDRLDAIVFRALEKDPGKRYQSMSQFEDDLRSALENSGLGGTGLVNELARRRRSILRFAQSTPKAVVALVLLLIITSGGGVVFWSKCSWFFESQHAFRTPETRWLAYLPPRHRKLHLSAADRQDSLDRGVKAIAHASITHDLYSEYMLDIWKKRANSCAELDSPAEEIRARTRILDYYQRTNADYRKDADYGSAAEELAECWMNQGNYMAALPLLKTAVSIRDTHAESVADLQNPRINLALGYVCYRLNRLHDAENALNDTIRLLSGSGAPGGSGLSCDGRQLAIAYAVRGDVFRIQGLWAPSEQSYAMAEKAMKSSDFKKSGVFLNELALVRAFVNLEGRHYQESNRLYDLAMPYVQEEYHDQKVQMQSVLDNYAYVSWSLGDFVKAIRLREESMNLALALAH